MLSPHFFQRVAVAVLLIAVQTFRAADVSAGGSSGNPFRPPAAPVLSIYDYRNLDNVSNSLEEFLSLNEDLPGSVKPATVTPDDAVRQLKRLFASPKDQAFLKAVGDAPKYRTADALNGAALVLIAQQRSAEALACLLHAAEKSPKSPGAWLNLASGALLFRQANEALALIARAESLGELPPGAWNIPGARIADYLRGYAQMLRGEYEAARVRLVRVVEAEPNLREAALALALVEARLKKNPRRSFLLGVWRHRGGLIVRDEPGDKEIPPEKIADRDAFTEGEQISPSIPDLLDVSKGKPGQLPKVKRPTTTSELIAMTEPYGRQVLAATEAAANQHNNVAGPAYQSFEDSNAKPLYKRRMIALYNKAVVRYGVAREIDRAARDTDALAARLHTETEKAIDVAMRAQEPIKRRHAEANNRPGHPTPSELRVQYAELNATTQAAIDHLSPLLTQYHAAVDREYTIRSSYMHGMLAHIGAPALRTALLAEAETARHEAQLYLYASVLSLAPAIGAMEVAPPVANEAGAQGNGPPCSDDDAKWSVTVDVELFEVELTCNSVSCEVSAPLAPPLVQGSLELGVDTSGTMSVYAGPKVSVPGIGSVKEGLYVTAGKEGFRDFGGKVEAKVSGGIGPVSVSRKVVDSSVSFIPGPDPGAAPGPLPKFGAD